MARPTLHEVHIDRPLTAISVGYMNSDYIGSQFFPAVPVQNISDKYFVFQKADWFRDEAAIRTPGTRAARIHYGVSSSTYTCVETAIATGVPDEIVDNADDPLAPLADGTRYVTDKVQLALEVDVAAQAVGNSIWSSSATPAVLWSNDTSDPLGDTETAMNTVVAAIGREANTGALGRGLWRYVKNHPDIVDRIKGMAGPTSPAVVSINAVAALFGVDRLLIGRAIKDTAADGATSSLSYVWGNHLVVAYVTQTPSLMSPTAGYVFTYKGRTVARYREDQEKQDVVEAAQSFVVKVVAADGGYLVKSAV